MKTLLLTTLLLFPLSAFADKYEDVNTGIREMLIALSQISVQGRDAATFAQVQNGLVKISKDIADMGKEYAATQDEVMKCKKSQEVKK